MRTTLAAALLAALALSALPGTASAGCVDDLLATRRVPGSDDPPIVERHDDGSYTVYPNRVANVVTRAGDVARMVDSAAFGFVNCVV